MPRTISEQIEDFNKSKATKAARQAAIMGGTGERGETCDVAEAEEFDNLTAEITAIDGHLKRLAFMEQAQGATAQPVIRAAPTAEPGSGVAVTGRVEPTVRAAERCQPGIRMARVAKMLVLGRLAMRDPVQLAMEQSTHDPAVVEVVKATVADGATNNPSWAGALVGEAGAIVADFVAYLR